MKYIVLMLFLYQSLVADIIPSPKELNLSKDISPAVKLLEEVKKNPEKIKNQKIKKISSNVNIKILEKI